MTAVLAISAYHPTMVFDWFLENLLVLVFVIALIASYRAVPLSRTSYVLIFLYLCFHEWGAHYKYDGVPLGEWIKVWLHTARNHYDRVLHFCFGLLLGYPMLEAYMHLTGVRNAWRYWFPLEASIAFGAIYEMIEATVAAYVSPEHGEAFVGMQGDMWDAQEDMALGLVGAVIAMIVTYAIDRHLANRPADTPRGAGSNKEDTPKNDDQSVSHHSSPHAIGSRKGPSIKPTGGGG